ncbi:hypothetical protein O3M35_003111 [Rhynocoris fuscipes]
MNLAKYHIRMKSDYLGAMNVRQQFLDYFSNEKHIKVRSSPVKPFCDPTLEFVNAGMNQFKNVFLGHASSPYLRATNSQKCIRVGGKHNDLNSVGYDTYHHTFFEMLGNWSFGDYFKADACRFAWNLITSKPFSLDPERLYVTYFGGDPKLSLPPDLESKEMWRYIGIKEDRILPFGMKDNFWEMGPTGPCGPCTEIHYDHLGSASRANYVNSDLPDLTELWNLVFIQYNKQEDGTLVPLNQNFVDTGMGLERLTAILQGKLSNYDTDLFTPLFQKIAQISKTRNYEGKFGVDDPNEIDTNYRILADHARMITVSLADNVFPDESHGLRRVIRKSLVSAEKFVPGKGLNLILELTKVVGEILGPVYPEILKNYKQIKCLLINEDELWKQVQSNVKDEWKRTLAKNNKYESLHDVQSLGLISAIKELEKMNLERGSVFSPEFTLILYDRYGLTPQVIEELARINGYRVDIRQLELDIVDLKETRRTLLYSEKVIGATVESFNKIIQKHQLKPTDDTFKYVYTRDENGEYHFKDLTSVQVQAILTHGKFLNTGYELPTDRYVHLLLDKTNFWSSYRGASDIGTISLYNETDGELGEIRVDNVTHYGSYIVHNGLFRTNSSEFIDIGEELPKATLKLDTEDRLMLMQNNTAAHLLTNAIKSKYIVNAQDYLSDRQNFAIKYTFYGEDISEGEFLLMEHLVNETIREGIDISCSPVKSSDLDLNDVYVPQYANMTANSFPVVTFKMGNKICRDVTTAPVVHNSKDIGEFSLVDITINRKKRECVLRGVTGERVNVAYSRTNALLEEMNSLSFQDMTIIELKRVLRDASCLIGRYLVPQSLRVELNHLVKSLEDVIKVKSIERKKTIMQEVIDKAKKDNKQYVLYYWDEDTKLEKLTRMCPDLPIMLFAYNNGHLTIRCTVPESSRLLADAWIAKVCEFLDGKVQHYLGHNSNYACGMKPLKLKIEKLEFLVEKAMSYADVIARDTLKENS